MQFHAGEFSFSGRNDPWIKLRDSELKHNTDAISRSRHSHLIQLKIAVLCRTDLLANQQ